MYLQIASRPHKPSMLNSAHPLSPLLMAWAIFFSYLALVPPGCRCLLGTPVLCSLLSDKARWSAPC